MRKILTLLLLPVLAFTSCHSDDSIIVPKATAKLIVEASSLETFVNKPVYFTVKDDKGNNVPVEATVVNVAKKESNVVDRRFKPTTAGEYQFKAKTAIPGRIYDTSEIITVKVSEPTKKEFSIDAKTFTVAKATLNILRVSTKNKAGEEVLNDKLVRIGDTYYNEYVLTVNDMGETFTENSIQIKFLVPNKSVKHSNGVITDYGKRIYPSDLTKNALTEIITYQRPSYRITNFAEIAETDHLAFYNLDKPKEGLDSQILPKSYFEFKFSKLGIDYIGDLTLSETIEK